ncbi:MAG TPA: lipid kinase [Nocardioidaceae bacterium]|nr:lipid kinase [Nocardioidaceae bacterium]
MTTPSGAREAERVAIVVNTGSRTGREAYEEACRRLEDAGLRISEKHAVEAPGKMVEVVRSAVQAGADLVVLGGGDGTVSCVAGELETCGVTLGLLPLGTANDFARTLGVPFDLAEACDTIVNGQLVDVDLGAVGEHRFVNVTQLGLAVGVTRLMDHRLKKVLGPLAYPITVLRATAQHRPFSVRLEFPDGDADDIELHDMLQVAVGSGVYYGGGNAVSPYASIDDRKLDVYAIPRGSFWQRWHLVRYFRSGRFVESKHVFHTRTQRVRITPDRPEALSIDGELLEPEDQDTELFEVHANALRVIVPQDSEAARLSD